MPISFAIIECLQDFLALVCAYIILQQTLVKQFNILSTTMVNIDRNETENNRFFVSTFGALITINEEKLKSFEMGKIIAMANQKGGVGKTTTSVNLATSLAVLGNKILIIDMDPQANCTSGFGFQIDTIQQSIYHCLTDNVDLEKVLLHTEVENLDLIPSSIDLVGSEIELIERPERERILRNVLSRIKNSYDYIIIDCSPSLGLLVVNALTAADSVLIPVQCEFYALEGISKLLNTIKIIQMTHNPDLEIEGFVLTMYNKNLRLANQVVEEVRIHFDSMVFDTIIQRNVKLSEAPSFGQPVLLYDAESKGAINHLNLAKELLQRNNKVLA